MRKALEFTGERLSDHVLRVKVMGGWIVTIENTKKSAITSQFIADKNHEWKILNPYVVNEIPAE